MSDENDIQLNEEIIREENDPAVLDQRLFPEDDRP